MKRLFFVLPILTLLFVPNADAACTGNMVCVGENDEYTPSADEIAAQQYLRAKHNTALCEGVGLASTCLQAEYDAVVPTPPAATIYTNDAAGTRTYFLDKLKVDIAAAVSTQRAEQKSRAHRAWDSASQAARDAACQALGLTAACQ